TRKLDVRSEAGPSLDPGHRRFTGQLLEARGSDELCRQFPLLIRRIVVVVTAASQQRRGNDHTPYPAHEMTPLVHGIGKRGKPLAPFRGQDLQWACRRPKRPCPGPVRAPPIRNGPAPEAPKPARTRYAPSL